LKVGSMRFNVWVMSIIFIVSLVSPHPG